MQNTPFALLKVIAKILGNALGGGIAGDLIVEVLPEVAKDGWEWWSKEKDEKERRAELEAIVQAGNVQFSRQNCAYQLLAFDDSTSFCSKLNHKVKFVSLQQFLELPIHYWHVFLAHMSIRMTRPKPDLSKRSFITQLVESFFDMAREWQNLTTAPKTGSPPPKPPVTTSEDRQEQIRTKIRELQQWSPTHLIFLLTFDPPRTIKDYPQLPAMLPYKDWDAFLSENPLEVSTKLQSLGAIVRSTLKTHLETKFSKDELQAMLKTRNLPFSGNKPDIAERLAGADTQGMWATLGDFTLLECTPWAWQTAKNCLERTAAMPVDDTASADKASKTEFLRKASKWALEAAAVGVIGNRADDVWMKLVTSETAPDTSTAPSQPASPLSPLETPTQPTPEPPSIEQVPAAESSRSARSHNRSALDFDWVTIPAGEFLMGSDKSKDKAASSGELPQHKLYLPRFKMARVPVTVAQFEQFVKATGYKTTAEKEGSAYSYTGNEWKKIKGAYWARPRGALRDMKVLANHPVTCVSWHDAQAFCQWAGVRLPTEAEWERAARGKDGRIYPWGNEAPDQSRCNFHMHVGDTTPVGSYPKGASPEGLLDMAGNVWEWNSTLYKEYPYNADDGRESGEAEGSRLVRGGAWDNFPYGVRGANRSWFDPDSRVDYLGFRVVLASPGS